MNNLPQVVGEHDHCYRCHLCLDPYVIGAIEMLDVCPRCGYDFSIIDITTEPITEDYLKKLVCWKAFFDAKQLLENWTTGYDRLISEGNVDYSLLHDYLDDLLTQMMPWLNHLYLEKKISKEQLQNLGDVFHSGVDRLMLSLEREEDLLRLTGQWDDNEEEIKQYWLKRMGISSQIPFEKREEIEHERE